MVKKESKPQNQQMVETWKGFFKPFNIFLSILVICTLVLVILNWKHYYHELLESSQVVTTEKPRVSLKPIRLDMARFEIEVLKPHKDMKKKFPNHPDMVINKLSKYLRKEENKTLTLLKKVSKLKHQLGIDESEIQLDNNEPTEKHFSRKLKSVEDQELPLCPEKSPHLLGPLYVKQQGIPQLNSGTSEFEKHFSSNLAPGGAFKPKECLARTKLAVIVAFRDRDAHLKVFLHHMHPIFQRQLLEYRIFVVEQTPTEEFNRGALMNIGYTEALKVDNFDCFAFHDVDLVPEDDRNIYECPANGPKHMSVAVNKWKYRLQYKNYFGGVTTVSRDQFKKINGFANMFYGWGGEDDDLNHRITKFNLTVNRTPAHMARFIMLKHDKVHMNEDLQNLMSKSKTNQLDSDGLTTLKYKKIQEKNLPLYTWILVDLPKAPPKKVASWWDRFQGKAKEGMNYVSGGIAKKIAETAIEIAQNRDEEQEEARDHLY